MGLIENRKAKVAARTEAFLRVKLEPGEKIEAIAFGEHGGAARHFMWSISQQYTLCLTDRRLLVLRCKTMSFSNPPTAIEWAEPRASVRIEKVRTTVNTVIDLRRVSDGQKLTVRIGSAWNREASQIVAGLGGLVEGRSRAA